MENTFLPENYKAPEGDYMKLKAGENTFRILSSAIVGYEYFTNEKKPVRSPDLFTSTPDIKVEDGKVSKVKHFWAFVVYNYNAEKIQVLELVQSGIRSDIKALVDNKKWGNPKGYDITITKVGDRLDTEYSTMPNPHSPIDEGIKTEYSLKKIDLTALFRSENPFETQQAQPAEEEAEDNISVEDISM